MECILSAVPGTYSNPTAQVMMTLSGISYVDEDNPSVAAIKRKIVSELTNPAYATQNEWALAWGPVVFKGTDNLCYVAKIKSTPANVPVFAVVMRGTVMDDWASVWEDIPTGQSDFSAFSAPGAMVSPGFLQALIGLTVARDPDTKTNLLQFLNGAITAGQRPIMFVTGHSQGGALVPMMLGWLKTRAKALNPLLHGYSFAGPTSGNPAFAQWVDSTELLTRVVNPLDVVPYGYAALNNLVTDNVPMKVTDPVEKLCLKETLDLMNEMLRMAGQWKQPSGPVALPRRPATGSLTQQISTQHHGNTYLSLLGAHMLDFGPP